METIPLRGHLADWVRNSIARLTRLANLGQNWDSYGSPPPSRSLIAGVIRWLHYTEVETLPEPEVVPACGGGVQLEWYLGDRELEIEFKPRGTIEYLATDNQDGTETEGPLTSLDDIRLRLVWLGDRQ